MDNETEELTEWLDAMSRRPGERYFTWMKRIKLNEEARCTMLLQLEREIAIYAEKPSVHWSELCRAAKAYGILVNGWRESKR
jgi:hypothetical protein